MMMMCCIIHPHLAAVEAAGGDEPRHTADEKPISKDEQAIFLNRRDLTCKGRYR